MKIKASPFYLAYYSLIGCLLLLQVVYTVYQTSIVVAHGRKQKNLENTQQQLAKEKILLQGKLAEKTSLLAFEADENLATTYQLISQPIVIDKSSSLAAAN